MTLRNEMIARRGGITTLAWFVIGAAAAATYGGETLFLFQGIGVEETQQIQKLYRLDADPRNDLSAVFAEARLVLNRHPENRPARRLLANALAANGEMEEAFATIGPLSSGPKPYALAEALRIAKWRNDRESGRALLDSYKVAIGDTWEYRFAKSEFEGKSDEAERILRHEFDVADESHQLHPATRYADFLMTRAKAKEALIVLDTVVERALKAGPTWSGKITLARSRSLWLLGRHDDALEAATSACNWLTHKDSIVHRQFLAHALASRYVLAMRTSDSFVAQRDAQAAVSNWGVALLSNQRALIDAVPTDLLVTSDDKRSRRMKTLTSAMAKAPLWEDGLWASLYLAAVFPDQAEPLRNALDRSPFHSQLLKSLSRR